MQPATKTEPKILEEERLLIRFADAWWRSRSGSPGLRWVMVREAMKDAKVQEALATLNWKPATSDKELYAAICAAIGKGDLGGNNTSMLGKQAKSTASS